MKKVITILWIILLLCGCARSSGDYERGYADGYAAAMAEYSRAMPEVTPEPTLSPTAAPTLAPTVAPTVTPSDDFTVYISRSGTMHKKADCSGMKHYTAMPYSVAKEYYDKRCSICFK